MKYSDKAKCPLVATPGPVGSDLFSAYNCIIHKGDTILVKTGLVVAIPKGRYGLIGGRSSIAMKGIQTHVDFLTKIIGGLFVLS